MDTIGGRVAALRLARHYNQSELAKKIGVKPHAISMIESGETKSLSGRVLAGLCRHLVTTPDFIMDGASENEDFERGMELAELMNLAKQLSPQALSALVDSARMVVRATAPVASPAMPFKTQTPIGEPPKPKADAMRGYVKKNQPAKKAAKKVS